MNATEMFTAARVEALFASSLGTGVPASRRQADDAIRAAVRVHGGLRGCLAEMATSYGEHPETAARRSAWARSLVERLYADRPLPVHCTRGAGRP
ncbi:hypothetical protein GCM10010124_12350 [Pilimelia terevasa]|uniref:Uncharacterized protein n=1 Tax=Pilimelia terevasa TaxID=53372 RepID=A0A8J3BH76_9ACTN|nr:hypothetical protein [Pilimelia terevasa]GGK21395.1 hypothetical protein GCM10010124_12350 [Pilimelia terevasa]